MAEKTTQHGPQKALYGSPMAQNVQSARHLLSIAFSPLGMSPKGFGTILGHPGSFLAHLGRRTNELGHDEQCSGHRREPAESLGPNLCGSTQGHPQPEFGGRPDLCARDIELGPACCCVLLDMAVHPRPYLAGGNQTAAAARWPRYCVCSYA